MLLWIKIIFNFLNMKPTKEWLKSWEKNRKFLINPCNLNEYFEKKEILWKKIDVLDLWTVSIPTWEIIVRDPLVYITRNENPYFLKTPVWEFKVNACVVLGDKNDCDRYAVIKLDFNNNKSVRFEEALEGNEDFDNFQEGAFFWFWVDSWLWGILDKEALNPFCDFIDEFQKNNIDKNLYDDYFSELFAKNYKENPKYQRDVWDWINWKIPGTKYNIPFFQSGFGDWYYPVYFWFDKNNEICSLIIQFINIESDYNDEDDDDEEDDDDNL